MIMIKFIAVLIIARTSQQSYLHGYDDSILYTINWIDPTQELVETQKDVQNGNNLNFEEITVQTDIHEQYKCKIPQIVNSEKDSNEKYNGPNTLELLSEIFGPQTSCSFRLEAYWTYELCHGRFIRQYHEEREGKTVKLQEYFLGRWDKISQDRMSALLETEDVDKPGSTVPLKKIDGLNMPYFQINMTDGTLCDLNGKPRLTKVLYVCYTMGRHEIYSLKETSICEYEVIVLSPLLCAHPKYRPQTTGENAINCVPMGDAKRMPKSLLQLEAESAKLQHQNFKVDSLTLAILLKQMKPFGGNQNSARVRLELLPLDEYAAAGGRSEHISQSALTQDVLASSEFRNFIEGSDCIQGGSGWWKYELCYGKTVTQFHQEKDGSKTVVNLGNFIKSGHLKWLKANPHKRPVVGSHLSYMYTMGSMCDQTGQPRQTEVKLKCVENKNSPGAVSLYLLEPRTCQYILGVESRLVCRLLEQVDEDGLLTTDDNVGFTRSEYTSGYTRPAQPQPVRGPDSQAKKKDVKIMVVLEDEGNHIADGDE